MSDVRHFDPHIRPIRLRDDLRQIANLIEVCFSQNIDDEGREYIKHIRQTANNYSGFMLENTTPENSPLPFHGYVWVDHGEIIGNLTLIPLRSREKGSYFIANVAVKPEFRGKGIAIQLTERAIQHVREHQGKQIFLQVRDDNAAALHVYQKLGFGETSRRTTWIYNTRKTPITLLPTRTIVSGRNKEDWSQQKLWLEALYPKEIYWNLPFRLEKMEPTFSNWLSRFVNGERQRTWAARIKQKLIGTVTLEHSSEQHDYLWLASSPIWEDEVIQSVLPVIQKAVFYPKRLAVNYPAGRAKASFELVNMRELNTLIWMRYKVLPIYESKII